MNKKGLSYVSFIPIAIAIIYIIVPVDLIPLNPLDDTIIALIMGAIAFNV